MEPLLNRIPLCQRVLNLQAKWLLIQRRRQWDQYR